MTLAAVLCLFVIVGTCLAIPFHASDDNAAVPPASTTQSNVSSSLEEILEGDRFDEFDWKLCKALGETEKGNIIISPISLKLVLAMVFEGASGETAAEITTALGLSREDAGRQLARKKFTHIVENFKSSKGEYELDLGTSIFIDKGVTPKPSYVRKLQAYEAQFEQVDFNQTAEAIKAINAWAAGVTKGNIKNLLGPGDASANTVLMVLSAIFFKGTWLYTFPRNQTTQDTFYADGQTPVTTNFMRSVSTLQYLEGFQINAQIVRLPYVGKKLSMYLVLPNNKTGLSELVNNINPFILKEHSVNMVETLVDLSLPSFKIEYTANLKTVLNQLGIQTLFGNGAQLNEIAEVANNSIAVSNVVQKAGIQVNEEGSTAYAATEAEVVNKFGDSSVITMKLDHPFLFYIKNEVTDTVLFVGNVVNPTDYSPPASNETKPVYTPTTPVAINPVHITPKPNNTGTISISEQVKNYFMKEAVSNDMKELIKLHYLTGTTSIDLEELVDLYGILKTTSVELEQLITFLFTMDYELENIDRWIKLYFLMEVTKDDLGKFLKLFYVGGSVATDTRALTKFFNTKGVTPDEHQTLIRYYLTKKRKN